MDILRSWVDKETGKERARIYHNIDPKSISITGLEVFFAHQDVYTPGGSIVNMYRIPLKGCPYITADEVQIKTYLSEHPHKINAGLYTSEIELEQVELEQ